MNARVLAQIGLALDAIGVGILFFWGPPQPSFEEGASISVSDDNFLSDGRTIADHNREIRKKRRQHAIMSRVGLGAIFVGFALQLYASFAGE